MAVEISGDDILAMIVESHLIIAGALHATGIANFELQANAIEKLPADPNPAIEMLRQSIIKGLRVLPEPRRPKLSIVKREN